MADGQQKLTNALYAERQHKLRPRQIGRAVAFAMRLGLQADRRRFGVVIVFQVVQAFGLGAGLLALRGVLGSGIPAPGRGVQLSGLVTGLIVLMVIGMVSTISGLILSMQQQVLHLKTSALACDRVTAAVAAADLRTFEDATFHDRVEQAVWAARDYAAQLATVAVMVLGTVVRVLGVTVVVVAMAWWLLPVLLVAAAPAIRVALQSQRGDFALRLELMENRRMLSYLLQVLTGRDTAKEVRAFGLANPLRTRMAAHYAEAIDAERRFHRVFLWRTIRARLLGDLLLAGTVAGVLVLAASRRLDLATAITVLGGSYLLSGQLRSVAGLTGMMGNPLLFVEALRGFLDAAPPQPAPPAEAEPFTTLATRRVSFSYPTANSPAVHDVSIELRAGEVTALVGENGSGKTTLAKILTGLYEPDTGTVLCDGMPVGDPARLRAVSTVLFQDFARYKLTGADNIGLGRPERLNDDEAILRAGIQAGAHDVLDALPQSYRTVLSTEFAGGVDLSTGQWQRVALARAYFRDAPFIVLDEPTAALDPKAEADLFAQMNRIYAGRTVLLITHRFSSVRHADRIFVLDHGRIVEHGTHTELMNRDGAYADLFLTQAAAYRESNRQQSPASEDSIP